MSPQEQKEEDQQPQWQRISARARRRLADSIPPAWRLPADKLPPDDQLDVRSIPASCGILSEHELTITDSVAVDIVANIASGTWTAYAVTLAFCKRAAIAQQLVNCLTVTMFDSALARARELDEYFVSSGGKVVGPLHGLPVSLKDNFNVVGVPSGVGFCAWAEEVVEEESTIVGVLRGLGAVVGFVKTNVPTAMMIAESVNNCYGRTVNPQNRAFTSGGSSGGESALIAMHGSPLGVGTDIGGSLRIPAACTGIYTLRPSYGRFPHFDARSGMAGQESIGSVHGPMARSIADLHLFTDNVANAQPWLKDPKCIPMPWRSVDMPAKPKLGILWHNGIVKPTPPVTRVLKAVVEKLGASGKYTIVDWTPHAALHIEAFNLMGRFFVADGGQSVQKVLDAVGEPWRPEMQAYADAEGLSVYELWQLQKQRTTLQKKYLDAWQAEEGLDAILGPVSPYAVPQNGGFRNVSYTGVFNVLDYSSTAFPTGMVAESGDVYPEGWEAWGEADRVTREEFDALATEGLPVSLQLTGRRLEEEKVMGLTERVCRDIA